MIPDCEGWWWYRPIDGVAWTPKKVEDFNGVLKFDRYNAPYCGVSEDPHVQWGERLYAPDQYPRYHRLTGEPVAVTHTSMNGRINVDFDKDECVVGIEILHAEGGK